MQERVVEEKEARLLALVEHLEHTACKQTNRLQWAASHGPPVYNRAQPAMAHRSACGKHDLTRLAAAATFIAERARRCDELLRQVRRVSQPRLHLDHLHIPRMAYAAHTAVQVQVSGGSAFCIDSASRLRSLIALRIELTYAPAVTCACACTRVCVRACACVRACHGASVCGVRVCARAHASVCVRVRVCM